MTKPLDQKALSSLIKKIGTTGKTQRDNIQVALVSCAFYAVYDRNLDPAIRLFQAVGGETYKAGMSKWLSLYAPVHFKEGKPLLSDKRQKEMAETLSKEDFAKEMDSCALWYEIDAANNKAPNVWDTNAKVKAFDEYFLKTIAQMRKHDVTVAEAMDRAHSLARAELAKVLEAAKA